MNEFKTGDEVLVSADGLLWNERIFLYNRPDGYHLCQPRNDYEVNAVANFGAWRHIKPAPRYETRVLGPVAMVQRLVDEGYQPRPDGLWSNGEGCTVFFLPKMWRYCGHIKPNIYVWPDSWLEKVEVKP